MRHSKVLIIVIIVIISFFLGRESASKSSNISKPNLFLSDSSMIIDDSDIIQDNSLLDESLLNKVYRCGNSMIYHPTTSHASFKRCKSKISELSITKAKELGMRHCKCKS